MATALPVAVTASLDQSRSVHSATFRRAVELAAAWLQASRGVELALHWVDDGANPDGGRRAAEVIVASSARAVVGHFASGAALAAAPVYGAAGLPLLLPAATAARLTGRPGVYRLCDPDDDYTAWIARCLAGSPWPRLHIGSDGSAHGDSVRQALTDRLPAARLADNPLAADALLFSGMFEPTVAVVERWLRQAGRPTLLLTDDAQSDQLLPRVAASPSDLRIFGFRVAPVTDAARQLAEQYRRRWLGPPGIYFFETVAALEIAAAWLAGGLPGEPVTTVLGPVTFDAAGESRPGRFACFRPQDGRLVEEPALSVVRTP